MQIEEYFHSISDELDALKNRVRYMIASQHWQTDGEWKESVLRTLIQRSASCNVTVGRGFIVDRERTSTQIDILVYDNSYPVLYKDADLVFVSPASCRAIIEVKTAITRASCTAAVLKLAENAALARGPGSRRHPVFVGLFAYEGAHWNGTGQILQDAADGNFRRIVDHVSVGPSRFVKFWTRDPANGRPTYKSWHDYDLNRMAPGYFIHNLITELTANEEARREMVWFPEVGKESHLRQVVEFAGDLPRPMRQFAMSRARTT
ncbi:MAG: DUF6602 domain-containing protein [Pseudomonadota bacterium]